MTDATLQLILSAQDKASSVLKTVGGAIDNVNKKAGNLASAGLKSMQSGFETTAGVLKTGFLVGLGGVATALGVVGTQAIKGAGQFEVYRATLTTMLGSQELANERLKEYADIGKSTPFELDQVVQLGNSLQAVGKYSRESVIMLGDLAAASGKPIEQVSGAYAKLASGQKGVAVDMFRDLLITTEDWTKATGKGVSKSGELMATTAEMMAVLPKIMKDKRYSGMMAEQSKTLFGIWSNLMDSISEKTRLLGEKLLPHIKPMITNVINFISSINLDDVILNIKEFGKMLQIVFGGGYLEEDEIPMFFYDLAEAIGGLEMRQGTLDFMRDLGDKITQVKNAVQPFIDKFNELNQNGEITKSLIAGLGGTIAFFVTGALASMIFAVASAVAPFVAVGLAIGGLFYLFQTNQPLFYAVATALGVIAVIILASYVPAMWAAASATIAATWPILAIAIAIGALVFAGVWLYQNWGTIWTAIVSIAGKAWESIKSFFSGVGQWFGDRFNEAKNRIVDTFNSLSKIDLAQTGKDIVQGLINGLNNKLNDLKDKARDIANTVQNGIKDALKIKSPSRVMMELGEYTGEGFALGMNKTENLVKSSSQNMAQSSVGGVGAGQSQSSSNTVNNNNKTIKNITQNIYQYNTNTITPTWALNF